MLYLEAVLFRLLIKVVLRLGLVFGGFEHVLVRTVSPLVYSLGIRSFKFVLMERQGPASFTRTVRASPFPTPLTPRPF